MTKTKAPCQQCKESYRQKLDNNAGKISSMHWGKKLLAHLELEKELESYQSPFFGDLVNVSSYHCRECKWGWEVTTMGNDYVDGEPDVKPPA